jgi:hypothetical protein
MMKLGKPAKKKTGFFVWDTTDGNVIFRTGETIEGALVALFLTSNSVQKFDRLPGFDAMIGRLRGGPTATE